MVEEHHLGEGRRVCEILEVLDPGPHERYRVRWDDGHEAIFFPGNDAHIRYHSQNPKHRASVGGNDDR